MRVLAVARRIWRQLLRDRRTLALILLAPMLVLTLLSLVFDAEPYRPKVALVNVPDALAEALSKTNCTIERLGTEEADAALRARRVDAVVSFPGPRITLEGSDPTASRAVTLAFLEAGKSMMPLKPEVKYLHGSAEMEPFDSFGPVLLGFLVFFFTFIVSGVSFVRERTTGTLERMLSTPVRRWEVVLGYALGFAGVVSVQSALIAAYSVHVLDMMLTGSFAWLLAITLLLAATAMTLGMLLSTFARNEFQMFQFVPLVIIPQIFFSGLFPLETMAPWLRGIGSALPLTYGASALRDVMIRGGGWADLRSEIAVLAGFVITFAAINVWALRRYRSV